MNIHSATQTWVVIAYPPLERENTLLLSSSNLTATLTILQTLAVADGRGPQLVICSIAPKTHPQAPYEAVAKIFDPLYYSFECQEAAHVPVNVARAADVDYTHEATTLDHLDKMAQRGYTGLSAPKYFGSWTLPCLSPTREERYSGLFVSCL